MSSTDLYVLTVRGNTAVTGDSARKLHNDTAGAEASIAGARALGDLSHKVYAPIGKEVDELMFVDVWSDPSGIQKFFSNKDVQAQAGQLFRSRAPDVWMPARGSFWFHLHAPAGKTDRFLGVLRAKVASPEAAIEAFRKEVGGNLAAARRRGQISHDLYVRMPPPGDSSSFELLGLDVWSDAAGMNEHYTSTMHGFAGVFAGAPDTSVWRQAPGAWAEW